MSLSSSLKRANPVNFEDSCPEVKKSLYSACENEFPEEKDTKEYDKKMEELCQLQSEIARMMSSNELAKPLLFHNVIDKWPASKWTPVSLVSHLKNSKLRFRIGRKVFDQVQRESDCHHVTADVTDFLTWLELQDHDVITPAGRDDASSLREFCRDDFWLYCDYTHMKELFHEDILETALNWSQFGLLQTGLESTFWLGSEGAYTPCHYDTYGYNLVAQIYGRKRWRLYPPEDAQYLYPSRIPYEESSVFSQVNIQRPDYQTHPKFKNTRCYDVTLNPGDVLYVPRHWWHFVESLETSVSINCWMDTPFDDESRLHEAITRFLMFGMMTSRDDDINSDWLNPMEETTSITTNMAYLNAARSKLKSKEDRMTAGPTTSCNTHLCYTGDGDRPTPTPTPTSTAVTNDVSMTSCECPVCDICREMRELDQNTTMTVEHIPPTSTSDIQSASTVTIPATISTVTVPAETGRTLSIDDVMSGVTQVDVIRLIAEHLQR